MTRLQKLVEMYERVLKSINAHYCDFLDFIREARQVANMARKGTITPAMLFDRPDARGRRYIATTEDNLTQAADIARTMRGLIEERDVFKAILFPNMNERDKAHEVRVIKRQIEKERHHLKHLTERTTAHGDDMQKTVKKWIKDHKDGLATLRYALEAL